MWNDNSGQPEPIQLAAFFLYLVIALVAGNIAWEIFRKVFVFIKE